MALYDEGLQRAGEWVSNYIRNSMLPNLNPNPMMGSRPTTNFDMGVFRGVTPSTMNLPMPPSASTGQPRIPTGASTTQGKASTTSTQGKSPVIPTPPRPQDEIAMGQLSAVPGYIAKFLVDIGRMALGLPEDGTQQPLPEGPIQPQGMSVPPPIGMPSEPSHGYRIAEGGKPEVVNAEGAYFPFESGQVTPLEPRQEGGEVEPLLGMRAYEASGRRMRGLPAVGSKGGPTTFPTGIAEYEESAARMRTPSPVSTLEPQRGMLPYNERLSRYGSGGLSAYGSPTPDKSQLTSFAQFGWKNPFENMTRYSQRRLPVSPIPLESMQGGGSVTRTLPDEEGIMTFPADIGEEMQRNLGRSYPTTPEEMELASRRRWATPRYPETRLQQVQEQFGPNVIGVTPGYQRSYYEAHPEERQAEYAMDLMRRIGGKEKFADVYEQLSKYGVPGKAPVPHWVQNEKGEWIGLVPGGVLPTGVPGKTTLPNAPGRKSEDLFEPSTGLTHRQDYEWKGNYWQPVGGKRVVQGPAPIRKELSLGEKYEKGLKAIRDTFFELDPIGNITKYTEGKSERQYLDTLTLYEQNIEKGMAPIEAANDAITKGAPEKVTELSQPPTSTPKKEGRYSWEGHEWNWTKKGGWKLTK